jgi:vacuolar-type H+-ATPase subunit I/STV1
LSKRNKKYGRLCDVPIRRNANVRFQAEVLVFLSAVQAATQLLEQAFRVFRRLRKAHQRQKTLLDVLEQHESELKSVKDIIGIIDDEETLQTASVATELVRLKYVQNKLVKFLEELDPKPRGKVQQYARQLTKGSSDESRLSQIMTELGQVKSMLVLRIQVANVGVIQDMGKQFVANTEVIERIDEFLKEEIGGCKGLKIARLIKGRRPSSKHS